MGSVPSTFATGYKYAGMGYTTAFDAAIPPLAARHVHEEFADTPCIDKGFYVVVGNNHYLMQAIRDQEPERVAGVPRLAAVVRQGLRPQDGQSRRRRGLETAAGRQRQRARFGGRTLRRHAAADHSRHRPGRRTSSACRTRCTCTATTWACPAIGRTTLETMKTLADFGGHLTHIQFHSYGGADGDEDTFSFAGRAAGRLRQRASEPDRRRRPGAVRRNHQHDRRRPAGLLPQQRLQDQVVLVRHRDGGRLRHRAHRVQATRA